MRQENLNPEIEEKLLNLQRFQEKQMKGEQQSTSAALAHNHHEYTSPAKQSSARKRLPVRAQEDVEWIVETPKRRPPRTNNPSEKKSMPNTSAQIENDVDRIIRSVEEETKKEQKAPKEQKASKEQKATKELTFSSPAKPVNNRRTPVKRENDKAKQQQQQLQVCVFLLKIALQFLFKNLLCFPLSDETLPPQRAAEERYFEKTCHFRKRVANRNPERTGYGISDKG